MTLKKFILPCTFLISLSIASCDNKSTKTSVHAQNAQTEDQEPKGENLPIQKFLLGTCSGVISDEQGSHKIELTEENKDNIINLRFLGLDKVYEESDPQKAQEFIKNLCKSTLVYLYEMTTKKLTSSTEEKEIEISDLDYTVITLQPEENN